MPNATYATIGNLAEVLTFVQAATPSLTSAGEAPILAATLPAVLREKQNVVYGVHEEISHLLPHLSVLGETTSEFTALIGRTQALTDFATALQGTIDAAKTELRPKNKNFVIAVK